MVEKLVIGNLKGGVGKTANTVMFAYELAEKGYKVLLCDLDPSANATKTLTKTYKRQTGEDIDFNESIMLAISNGNLRNSMVQVKENLFMLPTSKDLSAYPEYLLKIIPSIEDDYERKHMAYFKKLLESIEDEFDFIFIDVPPSQSVYLQSAIYLADYIIIVLQTEDQSLDGANEFFDEILRLYNKYDEIELTIPGILPVMKADSNIDRTVLMEAAEIYGEENIFRDVVRRTERIKRYARLGIPDINNKIDSDYNDRALKKLYGKLTDELIERVNR